MGGDTGSEAPCLTHPEESEGSTGSDRNSGQARSSGSLGLALNPETNARWMRYFMLSRFAAACSSGFSVTTLDAKDLARFLRCLVFCWLAVALSPEYSRLSPSIENDARWRRFKTLQWLLEIPLFRRHLLVAVHPSTILGITADRIWSPGARVFPIESLYPLNSPGSTSAWYSVPWTVFDSKGAPQRIEAQVDTASDHSMIQYRIVKQLGLKPRPLLEARELTGFGGAGERLVDYVWLEVECPLIRLARARIAVFVVHSKEIRGLLIGTPMIDRYDLNRKILDARDRHGLFPPGMSAESDASISNVIHPLFDTRKKEAKKKDKEIRDRQVSEINETISTIMHAKQEMGPAITWSASSATSFPASPSSSRATTWESTSTGCDDTASTAATSVSLASVSEDMSMKK